MDLIDGTTLLDLANSDKHSVPEEICWDVAQQLLKALEYLHKNDIVHRDIKLENVFVTYDGVVKIIDFGLSTSCVANINPSNIVGSSCYFAPEILN
jgi:serine/threonine protein kinase